MRQRTVPCHTQAEVVSMKSKKFMIFIVVILIILNLFQFALNYSNIRADMVPDEETAVLITRAILLQVGIDIAEPEDFGAEIGSFYRRVDVSFNRFRRAWIITVGSPDTDEVLFLGSNIYITISKRDGRIIDVRGG